jgi:hypothetical protein
VGQWTRSPTNPELFPEYSAVGASLEGDLSQFIHQHQQKKSEKKETNRRVEKHEMAQVKYDASC